MTDQAESDPVMEASEEELRDLSLQDAEELRAFQEKRRWFENKLQVGSSQHTPHAKVETGTTLTL